MEPITIVFLAVLLAKLFAEITLEVMNRSHSQASRGPIPEAFGGVMDQATYDKSIDYTLAKNSFGLVSLFYDSAILALFVLSGVLPDLFAFLTDSVGSGLWGQGLVLVAMLVVLSLPGIPLQWYSQFVLEERFGFNKSTQRLWLSDKIKGLLLSFALGYPLACLVLAFFAWFPQTWWILAFTAIVVFQLVLMIAFPRWILPLFNKLEPLPEGELRDRLLALAERAGFSASTIHIMDGSKRSGHSNAFFTGFGKFRRIVLFDTLVEQLEPIEVEAVLAHEIGHYKRGHVPKLLVFGSLMALLGFGVLAWLMNQPWFFAGFGFSLELGELRIVPALILFMLLSGLLTFWLEPLTSLWSRKYEYEADAFAKTMMGGDPMPLITSLRKMHQKNLANMNPHPLYSAFHYSHPTLLEREAGLRQEGA